MRIKLIQNGVADSADAVQRINFSVLTAERDWSVVVDFGYGDETVAHVKWSGSMAYEIRTEYRGSIEECDCVRYHSHIIPSVLSRLIGLFRSERISDIRSPQPIVTVVPIDS